MQQNEDHYNFIHTTDRKSLYTQIKGLVERAKDVASAELQARRVQLQRLLEREDKAYEMEFSNKVKSRIDEDIKARKQALLTIKEANERAALEFLEKKRVQQYMESCYEIREALRCKERHSVQACQREQMLDHERSEARARNLSAYWQGVLRRNNEREDERQANEVCLKRKMTEQMRFVLDAQLQEHAEKRATEQAERQREAEELNALLEELRKERFDLQRQGLPQKTLDYRHELLDMIAARKREHEAAEAVRIEAEQRERWALQRLEVQEREALHARKMALRQATLEYIAYARRLRALEADGQRQRDERIDDLQRVDICTKSNIKRMLEKKAAEAARCHAELRRQICEQRERRAREEAERRENKMLENRFVRDDLTREQIIAQRQRNRAELDAQIVELRRLRALEESNYKQDLQRASNDPEFCAELAEQYMRDGTDYLEPHPNWRVLACPTRSYIPKAPAAGEQMLPTAGGGDCIEPCGCTKTLPLEEGCGRGGGGGGGAVGRSGSGGVGVDAAGDGLNGRSRSRNRNRMR